MNDQITPQQRLIEQLRCEHDWSTTFALEIRCTLCGLVKEGTIR